MLAKVFDQALAGGGAKSINFQELAGDLAQITFDYPFRIPPYFALIIRAIRFPFPPFCSPSSLLLTPVVRFGLRDLRPGTRLLFLSFAPSYALPPQGKIPCHEICGPVPVACSCHLCHQVPSPALQNELKVTPFFFLSHRLPFFQPKTINLHYPPLSGVPPRSDLAPSPFSIIRSISFPLPAASPSPPYSSSSELSNPRTAPSALFPSHLQAVHQESARVGVWTALHAPVEGAPGGHVSTRARVPRQQRKLGGMQLHLARGGGVALRG